MSVSEMKTYIKKIDTCKLVEIAGLISGTSNYKASCASPVIHVRCVCVEHV